MRIGVQQLLIVLVIVIIIFGPTQITKLTKMFGKSVKGFKDGMDNPKINRKGYDGVITSTDELTAYLSEVCTAVYELTPVGLRKR